MLPDTEKLGIAGWGVRVYDESDPFHVAKSRMVTQVVQPTNAFPIVSQHFFVFDLPIVSYFNPFQSVPLLVPQYLHESVFHKHIEALGGKVDKGVSLVGLAQDTEGVTVELSQTVDGVSVTVNEKFDWVIGADGAHSGLHAIVFSSLFIKYDNSPGAVRKSLDIPFVGETRESEKMYIADCEIEGVEEVVSDISRFTRTALY